MAYRFAAWPSRRHRLLLQQKSSLGLYLSSDVYLLIDLRQPVTADVASLPPLVGRINRRFCR